MYVEHQQGALDSAVVRGFNSWSSCVTAVCSTPCRTDQSMGVVCSTGLDVRCVHLPHPLLEILSGTACEFRVRQANLVQLVFT
jgi:hypothetical protein